MKNVGGTGMPVEFSYYLEISPFVGFYDFYEIIWGYNNNI